MTDAQPDQTRAPNGWTHAWADINGVRLHYVESGSGTPVVLLHGFPEFWYSWRHQIPVLASAGFRALAPDLRGYNESDKPAGVSNYRVLTLADELAGFIRETVGGAACVAGHDWGGVLAYLLAARHPSLVRRLAILNAPHPAAMQRELARNPGQWVRSSYFFFFQIPALPERRIRANNYRALERAFLRQPVPPGTFTPDDIDEYKRALARPGALTAALNYYRAAVRYRELNPDRVIVKSPTLLIWGGGDHYLGAGMAEGLERWVPDLRIARLPGAGHWVQNARPDEVSRLLIAFFRDAG